MDAFEFVNLELDDIVYANYMGEWRQAFVAVRAGLIPSNTSAQGSLVVRVRFDGDGEGIRYYRNRHNVRTLDEQAAVQMAL